MSLYSAPTITTLCDLPIPSSTSPALIEIQKDSAPIILSHTILRNRIFNFAQSLIKADLPPGSVVAIVVPNSPHFIISFLAVTSIACTAAPLNAAYTADEFNFYLQDAAVHTVLIRQNLPEDSPILTAARNLNLNISIIPDSIANAPTQDEISAEIPPLHPQQYIPTPSTTALFLHTSGTTSRPKGVPLSHANLTASITNIANTYHLTEHDRCLLVMPLFHVHGLMAATLTTLATGGAVILPPTPKFSASAFWPSLIQGGATWYTAVPTIQQILLAKAATDYPADSPPPLRFIRSCSASLAPSVLERLESTFHAPVLEAYAMTEAAHQMTSNPLPEFGARKPGSVGLPQNVQLAILDDDNKKLPVGSIGEVCIQGNNVTAGYKNNPKANVAAFAGGWFHTGDQGSVDEEGYLTLTGRIKELVNRGGEKISPLEVDAALLSHPLVSEAVSFAVPDEKYGEEVNAAVILKEGSTATADELTEFAKGKLAFFKIPKRFFICDDLPRTATGKIQRRIVSKHFLDQLNEAES